MKNVLKLLSCVLFLVVFSTTLFAQPDTLTILHVNDTHSTLAPLGPREGDLSGTQGGIARLASIVGQATMDDPNLIKLHAGDLFIGDMFFNVFFGVPELQILHSLGFDAMAVGNHEFDLMPETLLGALTTAFSEGGFPLLSANLNLEDPDVAGLQDYVFPYITKEVGNVKVGIFGLTTPETNVFSQPSPAYVEEDIIGISAGMVQLLNEEECDVILCLSHLGFDLDTAVASYVPGIHVIIGGHSHDLLLEPYVPEGSNTMIVQSGAFYTSAGKLKLSVDDGNVELLSYESIPLDASVTEEPSVAATVDYLIGEVEAIYGPVYSEQITNAAEFFEEEAGYLLEPGPHDTPIGNLVTDAFRATTGTDVAMEPCGSTAQPLYQGPIVAADIFRTVGYGFNTDNGLGYRICTLDLNVEQIITVLEFGVSNIEVNDEYLIQVSGMSYKYDPTEEVGSRIVLSSIMIDGEPIDLTATYSVTTNEFMLMVLDYLGFGYSNPFIFEATSEFEVTANYVSQFDLIYPVVEGRIYVDPLIETDDVITDPENILKENYPNPFNPTTKIEYSLINSGQVSLEIFSIKGQKVKTLVNGNKETGSYTVIWNGKDDNDMSVVSGVYLYKLKTGNYEQTRKMILLK